MHPIIYTFIVIALTSVVCKTIVNVTLLMIIYILNFIMDPLIFNLIVVALTSDFYQFYHVIIYNQCYKINQTMYSMAQNELYLLV